MVAKLEAALIEGAYEGPDPLPRGLEHFNIDAVHTRGSISSPGAGVLRLSKGDRGAEG